MMQSLLGKHWVLLADVTNSTSFFWALRQAATLNRAALFEGGPLYAACMESIFGRMANVCSDRLVAHLGNTMGDGFILVGQHGNGSVHITKDAPRALQLARDVKTYCDAELSDVKVRIATLRREKSTPRELPDLRMKVTLHHGFIVTMLQGQRFVGDTVNYCARIAGAAFDGWNEGVVLTKDFFDILPEELKQDVASLEWRGTIRYPEPDQTAYRLGTSKAAIWSRVKNLADPVRS